MLGLRRPYAMLIVATINATPCPAVAQQGSSSGAQVLDAFGDCRRIADDRERLACFDRAADRLARDRAGLVVLDREDMKRTRRSLFGMALPNIRIFGRSDDDVPKITEIKAKVASAQRLQHGFYRIRLDDESVWETVEGAPYLDPAAGDAINIKAGTLGSFRANVRKERPVRIKRLQ